MLGVQTGQRVYFHELRAAFFITTQIDAGAVATAENPPRLQGDGFRLCNQGFRVSPDEPVFNAVFALFLVGVRVNSRLRVGEQMDLDGPQDFRRASAADNADRKLTSCQKTFNQHGLAVAGRQPLTGGRKMFALPNDGVRGDPLAGAFGHGFDEKGWIAPDFFDVQNAEVAEGQRITQTHLDNSDAVALLGIDVAEVLFNTRTNLLGQKVRINGQIFEVVGVLAEQGGTGFQNDDNRVLVPLTTAQQRRLSRPFPDQVDMIYVQASSAETVEATIDDVSQILRSRHTRSLGEDDFDILNTQAFLETATEVAGTMTLFLGEIAGISLLVGGIGRQAEGSTR